MGAIATWLASLLTSLGAYLGVKALDKFTMMGVYVAVYIGITVTFAASINSVFYGLVGIAPPGGLFRAGLEMMPSGAGNCIAALATAHLASVSFGMFTNLLSIKMKA